MVFTEEEKNTLIETIEALAHQWVLFMQHSFFMMLAGVIVYFTLTWVWMSNNKKVENFKEFWIDQKGEIIMTIIVGLMVITWDDEIINAVAFIQQWRVGDCNLKELIEGCFVASNARIPNFLYFFIGPVTELLYQLFTRFKRIKIPYLFKKK